MQRLNAPTPFLKIIPDIIDFESVDYAQVVTGAKRDVIRAQVFDLNDITICMEGWEENC